MSRSVVGRGCNKRSGKPPTSAASATRTRREKPSEAAPPLLLAAELRVCAGGTSRYVWRQLFFRSGDN